MKKPKIGTRLTWKSPEECDLNPDFVEAQARGYRGKLRIAKIVDAPPPSDVSFLFVVSNNGVIITEEEGDFEGTPALYSPYWFNVG